MDKSASWLDWRAGEAPGTAAAQPPAVPASCDGLGAVVLDPIRALLSSAIATEASGIAAHPESRYDVYGRFDIQRDTSAEERLATQRASMAAGGLTATDSATAGALQASLVSAISDVAAGSLHALNMETWLPGTARRAFEADRMAVGYAIQLVTEAGRCAGAPTSAHTPP
jgi:hypothetical protein